MILNELRAIVAFVVMLVAVVVGGPALALLCVTQALIDLAFRIDP